jgi:hypothetical protein
MTSDALDQLTDRELRDIGLSRAQLRWLEKGDHFGDDEPAHRGSSA